MDRMLRVVGYLVMLIALTALITLSYALSYQTSANRSFYDAVSRMELVDDVNNIMKLESACSNEAVTCQFVYESAHLGKKGLNLNFELRYTREAVIKPWFQATTIVTVYHTPNIKLGNTRLVKRP